MDHIQLYKNCNEVLQLLMTTQYTIFYDDLNRISLEYASLIIQEFTYKGFAKKIQIKKWQKPSPWQLSGWRLGV